MYLINSIKAGPSDNRSMPWHGLIELIELSEIRWLISLLKLLELIESNQMNSTNIIYSIN